MYIYSIEDNYYSVTPELPWSIFGSTGINFIIANYMGITAPTWISVNLDSGMLKFTAPQVSSDSDFEFYIDSIISGQSNPIHKLIKITVANCAVLNCLKCSGTSGLIWLDWNSGFTLSNNIWVIKANPTITKSNDSASDTSQVLRTTCQATLITAAGIIAIFSLFNSSSISSLWSMINQVQLLYLLLLTRSYIPLDVETTITGMKIALNFPNVFNFQRIKMYSSITNVFNFELSNSRFSLLDIQSESSVYNTSPILFMTILVILLHLPLILINRLLPEVDSETKWRWVRKSLKWIVNKAYIILTFGWYIRTILEMNQFVLISVINEISIFNTSSSTRIISFVIAILILIWWIIFIIITLCLALSSYIVNEEIHNKIGEFFTGLKMLKKAKIYLPILLLRRAFFVAMLIIFVSPPSWVIISILWLLQLLYLFYLITQRPFKEAKDNIIEIINEIFFLILLSSLIYLNWEENWNDIKTTAYIWIITSNNIIVFSIVISKFCLIIILSLNGQINYHKY